MKLFGYKTLLGMFLMVFGSQSAFAQLPAGGPVGGGGGEPYPGVYTPATYDPSTGRVVSGGVGGGGVYAGPAYNGIQGPMQGGLIYNANQPLNSSRFSGTGFGFGVFNGFDSDLSASGLANFYSQGDSYIRNERGNFINPQTVGNPQIYLSPLVTNAPAGAPRPVSSPTANFGAYRNLVIDRNPQTLFNEELPAREGLLTGQRTNTQSAFGGNNIPFREQTVEPERQNSVPVDVLGGGEPSQFQLNQFQVNHGVGMPPVDHQVPVPFFYQQYRAQREQAREERERNEQEAQNGEETTQELLMDQQLPVEPGRTQQLPGEEAEEHHRYESLDQRDESPAPESEHGENHVSE